LLIKSGEIGVLADDVNGSGGLGEYPRTAKKPGES